MRRKPRRGGGQPMSTDGDLKERKTSKCQQTPPDLFTLKGK